MRTTKELFANDWRMHALPCAVIALFVLCSLASAQTPPPDSADPAAKDAYVATQLARLFAGAPVRVTPRLAFGNALYVNVVSAAVPDYSIGLLDWHSETTAIQKLQEELRIWEAGAAITHSAESLKRQSKPDFDEFYYFGDSRAIGRRGSILVQVSSNPPGGSDAVLMALAKNLQADPALLPNLVRYAYVMHFGDTAALKVELSNLKNNVPELVTMSFVRGVDDQNSVNADYTDVRGGRLLMIYAEAYDSEQAAIAGLELDIGRISVSPDATTTIQGVKVYEYTRYGPAHMRFHVGPYTFDLNGSSSPLLQKTFSALVKNLAPKSGDKK